MQKGFVPRGLPVTPELLLVGVCRGADYLMVIVPELRAPSSSPPRALRGTLLAAALRACDGREGHIVSRAGWGMLGSPGQAWPARRPRVGLLDGLFSRDVPPSWGAVLTESEETYPEGSGRPRTAAVIDRDRLVAGPGATLRRLLLRA